MTDRDLLAENGCLKFRVQELERERERARNDALEEAAKEVADLKPLLGTGWNQASTNLLRRSAEAIRSLKGQP